MHGLSVLLVGADSGREAGRHALPSHTRERLIADAQLAAVIEGCLPNRGEPLDEAEIALRDGGIVARLRAGDLRYERRFPASCVADDVSALVARLHAGGALPAGLYRYRLLPEAAPGADARPPALRRLPVLERRSLASLGAVDLPRCAHATILLPRREAVRLAAVARANAEVEVGLLLLAQPFLAQESVPCPLGVRVTRAVAVARGTAEDPCHVRIPPAALASVAVDAALGEVRAGIAHSHPGGEGEPAFFLSAEDKAFASGFFFQPWQFQLVLDAAQARPEHAMAAFAWVEARLSRVCFQIVDDRDRPEKEGAQRWQ